MSNLNGLNLDPNVAESDGGFTVLPAGKYKSVIVADELKDTKANNGKRLVLKLQIIEGQYAQEIVEDGLNIINQSSVAQAIGQGVLKRICNLCSVPFPPTETAGLYGKPMVISVGVKNFTSNTSGKELQSNEVKKYEPADTPIPQAQPQVATQAQPQVATAGGW